jgi:hypothetical protein
LELQAVLATVTERPLLPVIDLFQQLMLKSAKQVCQNINLSINRIFSSQKQ